MEEGQERDSSPDQIRHIMHVQCIPSNGFGVPDIYVEQGEKEQDVDRLFVDGDNGDYGEEICED
jgi:hypothetical protein